MLKEPNNIVEIFRRRFSQEAGWEVFVDWGSSARGPLTNDLPQFLKEKQPGWIVKRLIVTWGRIDAQHADAGGVLLPHSKISSHLKTYGWIGEMSLSLGGAPLVIRNFLVPSDTGGLGLSTLIAYKDEKPLLKLFTQAARWSEARHNKNRTLAIFTPSGVNLDEPRPDLCWDDLILPGSQAEDIRANAEGFFKSGQRYKDLGIPHKRGFLLAGPPGNGKTLTAKIIASDRKLHFCWLKLTDRTNDEIVSDAFNYSYRHAPGVLLIEDLDRIAHNGGVTMSNILNQLDGLTSGEGVLVLATTNAPEKLDPALIHRPNRFDRIWRLALPGEPQRLTLLRRKAGSYFSEEALTRAAAQSGGFSMAYTQEIITNSLVLAANAGQAPADAHLAASLAQIKGQYKNTWAREGLGKEADAGPMLGFAAAAEAARH